MALFSGQKVDQNTLGRKIGVGDSCKIGENAHLHDGIAELAIAKGYSVGLVTTASVTDATPAALYAKGVQRRMEYDAAPKILGTACEDIASQLTKHPADKFKVIFGGGRSFMRPVETSAGGNGTAGKRQDGRDIEQEWLALPPNGGATVRRLLQSREDLLRLDATSEDQQILGIFGEVEVAYHMDVVSNGTEKKVPRLVEMSEKAVRVLQAQSGSRGYFLMIEGALIDKAEHANKMRLAADELEEFSAAIDAVRAVIADSEAEGETLLIVTADHGHAITIPAQFTKNQSIYGWSVALPEVHIDDTPIVGVHFATGPGASSERNYTVEMQELPHFVQPAVAPMKKGAHGAEDVGLWAHGPYAWLFSGTLENTEVAYVIKFLLCLDDNEQSICSLDQPQETSKLGAAFLSHGMTWRSVLPLLFLATTSSLLSVALTLFVVRRSRRVGVSSSQKNITSA